jgi:hemerythrin HHE cation binding domain-containing protein
MTDLKPDVVRLILSDHETFRAKFAQLDDLRDQPQAAAVLWGELAAHLEVHASAEEAHFYPALLKDVDDSEDETKDAVHDHDEIRQGIRRAAAADVGGDEWWAGIQDAHEANDDHLAEEERDDLPDFLRAASVEERQTLGGRFKEFQDEHPWAAGLDYSDKDPEEFVEENR